MKVPKRGQPSDPIMNAVPSEHAPKPEPDWLAGGTKSSNANKTHRNVVGAEIRRRRKQLRWSQSRLAKYLHDAGLSLSRSSLAKIECGMVWVGDFEVLYFARVLGSRVQDFFPKIGAQEQLNDVLARLLGTNPDSLKKKTNGSNGGEQKVA